MIALALAAIPKPPFPVVVIAGTFVLYAVGLAIVSWLDSASERSLLRFFAAVLAACLLVLLWAIVSHAATLSRCTW